jgi:hypothetical protein
MDWLLAGLALGGFAIWFLVEIAIVRELVWLHTMWGLPVALGLVAAAPLVPLGPEAKRELWLACGIASSLLYAAMNLIGSWQWPGYSSASRVVSELSAVGAPSRPLWVVLGLFYTLLAIAFGWGVVTSAGDNKRLRIAGVLLVVYGALGVLSPFTPMHQREVLAASGATVSDTLHLVMATAIVVLFLAAVAFAAGAVGKTFRAYSVTTLILLVAFAIPIFREAPRVNANLPTPFIGVWERLDIAAFLVWVGVLALALLGRGHAKEARAPLRAAGQPA